MFTPPPLQRTLPAALRDLASQRAEVRASAARDLAVVGRESPDASAVALEPLLRDPSPAVRGEAALALGALGSRTHVDALRALLEDADTTVRQYAVMALGQVGGEEALRVLEQALREAASDVRFQVLLAIAAMEPRRGFEVGLEALGDEDVWIASEAALLLGELLSEGRDEAQSWCTEACRARAREALRERLEGASGRVALCAAMALARLGDERGRERIVAFLQGTLAIESSDDHVELRLQAIERLGELGGPGAAEALAPLAWRLIGSVEREHARAALARLGDARAKEKVLAQLRAWSGVGRAMGLAMARAGRVREAVPDIVALARAGRVDPVAAVDALAAIGDEAAVRGLEEFSRGDGEAREAARDALVRMGLR
jgi:HEAT repeat protein